MLERVLDDSLVLLDEYGAGGVDNVAARFGLVIQAINCFEEQLALYGRAALDVDRILGGLDGHVLGYDARAAARRVQQDTIEVLDVLDFAETQQRLRNIFTPDKKKLQINSNESKYLADLAAIQVAHNRVGDSQAVQVADDRVETLAVGVVGHQAAGVLHQGGDVAGLAAGRRAHVEHLLVLLGRERHHGQHTGRALQHVVAGQVLGRGADRHLRLVDDKADLGPLANRIQVDAAVDERLGEVASTRLQRIRANGDRTLHFVRLEQLDHLAQREQAEQLVDEELVVRVVQTQIGSQLVHVVLTRPCLFDFRQVKLYVDNKETNVGRLFTW